MEWRLCRRKIKEPHLQFGLTPSCSPGSLFPTNADVVSRLLMILVQMEEHSVHERRAPMKRCMAQVAQEILELRDQQRRQNSCEGGEISHVKGPLVERAPPQNEN